VLQALVEPPPFLPDTGVWILKASIASGLAWWLGNLVGQPKPYFAVLAVIIAMQAHTYGSLLKAAQFLLGVFGGLVLGVLALRAPGLSVPIVAALIFVALVLGTRVKVGPDTNVQIAISALLLLAIGAVNWGITRLWETALGGVVAVVVAGLFWPPNPVRHLRKEIESTRRRFKADLVAIYDLLVRSGARPDPASTLDKVRANQESADSLVSQVGQAEDALRWNIWHAGERPELDALDGQARLLAQAYQHARSLAREVADLRPRGSPEPAWMPEARSQLWDAMRLTQEALDRRLGGGEPEGALRQAREARRAFLRRAGEEPRAAAIAVDLAEMAADIATPREVEEDGERSAFTRVVHLLRRHRGEERSPVK